MWKNVDALLLRGIAEDAFPGCAVAVGQRQRVFYQGIYGQLAPGSPVGVTSSTCYDVGRLTQVMATVPLTLIAVERGMICLDDPITLWLDNVPADKKDITLYHLLTHTSGLAAPFLLPEETESGGDALQTLLRHPLAGAPGSKVRVSAMGYILLGFLLERLFQMPLDKAVRRYVTVPLGMSRTGYLPAGVNVAPASAHSESEEWQAGQPQDGNARFLHGVAGHAGLFTCLDDAVRFAAMLASGGRSANGVFLSERALHLAITDRTRGLNEARGYGFGITRRSDPFLGNLWPSGSFGVRDGLSGSLMAVSPEDGFFVTLLANGFTSPRERLEMERLQKLLLNAAYAAFQHEAPGGEPGKEF